MVSLVVLLLVVSVAVAGAVSRRRRRAAVAARAAAREWTYLADDRSLVDHYPGPPFDQGRGRRATNVVRGRYDGRELVAFDHSYRIVTSGDIGDGSTTEQHDHSVVALSLGVVLPPLDVAPRSMRSPLGSGFLGADPEVGDPAFDRVFRVSAGDPSYALEVLVPELRAALLRRPDLTWRFDRDAVLAIRAGQHDPDEIEPTLQVLQAVIAAIPEPVWARARGDC